MLRRGDRDSVAARPWRPCQRRTGRLRAAFTPVGEQDAEVGLSLKSRSPSRPGGCPGRRDQCRRRHRCRPGSPHPCSPSRSERYPDRPHRRSRRRRGRPGESECRAGRRRTGRRRRRRSPGRRGCPAGRPVRSRPVTSICERAAGARVPEPLSHLLPLRCSTGRAPAGTSDSTR